MATDSELRPVPDPTDPTLIAALLGQGPRTLGGLQAELLFYQGQYLFHYQEQGGDHFKLLTPDAVRLALSGGEQDSGWLPPGLLRCGHTPRGPFAVLWQPPARRTIALITADDPRPRTLTVALPGLLLAGLATRYWVWALPDPQFSAGAPLYHAPLPNVYPDGAICWGGNRVPPATPAALPAVWQLFLTAPFNGHIAAGHTRDPHADVRVLLQQLATAEVPAFPTPELVPLRGGDTAQQMLERILAQ